MKILLYYKDKKWNICTEKVKYIQNGKEIEQYVGSEGHDWWVDFADQWEHTEIIEFIPIEPTDEQLARFEEISQLNIPDGFSDILSDYVKDGAFPDSISHPLIALQLKKENEELKQLLADLTEVVLLGGAK